MDKGKIFYIFGSFSRKKQDKHKSLKQSLSVGSSPLHQKAKDDAMVIPPRTLVCKGNGEKCVKQWECGICKKELVEPRLLGCLHSFCTKCLQGLHQEGQVELWNDVDGGSSLNLEPEGEGSRSGSGSGSAASGYESEPREQSSSENSWIEQEKPQKFGIVTKKISGKSVQLLVCPRCQFETYLPLGGVSGLPLNYVLLRKMMNRDDESGILCDLCTSDNKAEIHCSQCLVSICQTCAQTHSRQRPTSRHSLLPLEPPTQYCTQHPVQELSVYCATCQLVICRECGFMSHLGHALTNAAKAASERARLLKDAVERAKGLPEQVDKAYKVLNMQAMEIDKQAALVESQVATFSDQYRRAVDAHCRSLKMTASRTRAKYKQRFIQQETELGCRLQHANDAMRFAEELLSSCCPSEVLSLSGGVLRRLDELSALTMSAPPPAPRLTLREPVLAGRVTAALADPARTVLRVDGLQDLKVYCKHEAIVELRDSNGARVWCGGERVAGYFRQRDSTAVPDFADVRDRNDGTYVLTICPQTPGAYLFGVTLNNTPIKDSPFPCSARVLAPHWGVFHCCSFCSARRRGQACGCGGSMGDGYKGCGHGHPGHPGARHWSCCGSLIKNSVCTRPKSTTYQFSL